MRLSAIDNLHYPRACFLAMAASDRTPQIYGMIEPSPDIPMGALIVEEIAETIMTSPRLVIIFDHNI